MQQRALEAILRENGQRHQDTKTNVEQNRPMSEEIRGTGRDTERTGYCFSLKRSNYLECL